jgi:hypothetical protein
MPTPAEWLLLVAVNCIAAGIVWAVAFALASEVVQPYGPTPFRLVSLLMAFPILMTTIHAAALARRFGGTSYVRALVTGAVVMTWGLVVLPAIPQEAGGMRPNCWAIDFDAGGIERVGAGRARGTVFCR